MRELDLIARLVRLRSTPDGWSTLYRDPADGAVWEKTYPHGDHHGGGEPVYLRVDSRVTEEKYGQN